VVPGAGRLRRRGLERLGKVGALGEIP